MAKHFQTGPGLTNFTTFAVRTVEVVTAGTPVQGPNLPIPDGAEVSVTPKTFRTIFVAPSQADLGSDNTRVTLGLGRGISLKLANLNQLWFDASSNGAKVELLVEN